MVRSERLGGGCIGVVERLFCDAGGTFVLKRAPGAPAALLACEAEGLSALHAACLADPAGLRVPRVVASGVEWLLLEDLGDGARGDGFWEAFGHALARLHGTVATRFGFASDNFLGATPQPNRWTEDGHDFFAAHRLGFQTGLAASRGLLERADRQALERIAGRLRRLVPAQPASLLHGDLWSGNVHARDGRPAVLDPAVHHGWAEAEIAMTRLFGGFPPIFYAAYVEARPLDPGWEERLDLYNLYHLLNHLNLFGAGYLGEIRAVLARFA